MAKRPWRIFKEIERPYTRFSYSKKHNKIPGSPVSKLRMNIMGLKSVPIDQWKYAGHIISIETIQLSDYALESVRTNLTKYLEEEVKEFLFIVRKYPHHVVREHSLVYGAGADRISQGMRLSFGKPYTRAAQIHYKDIVLSIYFNKLEFMKNIDFYLEVAKKKLSGKYKKYLGENIAEKDILKSII
ncbi:50S ribosomal protein L10e [Nanobdella aerobiophila]|uniref:50S ribosomal protein L10e n=1 Tax=Nanobdella aerobiophila TaxID=2586965 RepID=A0A915SLD4_9ARCH|nr:50S ribosomal protein L16 [Nanobdella aerobiophila]BBL45886.1 50S ribosomal protein L10e [Nanobdella aerobiophila]